VFLVNFPKIARGDDFRKSYRGFRTTPQPAAGGTYSWMTSFRRIFPRSANAFSRSLPSAALAASGLSEKRVGTGPEMTSPSNISHARFHSARSTAGTLSLGKQFLSVTYSKGMIATIMCVLGLLLPATITVLYRDSTVPIVHVGFVNVVLRDVIK
jgi:hypothetical protein